MVTHSNGERFELVADGFSFPTSLTFDEKGMTYFGHFEMHAERGVVAEARSGKLWRFQPDS